MGLTHVTAQVVDVGRTGRPYEAEFLVDTGSLHCLAPASRLREAGVAPEGRRVYERASGEPVEYRYGFARISFSGDETVSHVVFGPEDAEPILGVVALGEHRGDGGPGHADAETAARVAARMKSGVIRRSRRGLARPSYSNAGACACRSIIVRIA